MPPKCATDTLDNPLWQYAVGVYSHHSVQLALLQLQDEHGADVLLLLAQLFQHSRGQGWPQQALPEHYLQWREQTVVPLRRIRRQLDKSLVLRSRLQQLEIEAEQQGLAYLWQWLLCSETFDGELGVAGQVGCQANDDLAVKRIYDLFVVAKQAGD